MVLFEDIKCVCFGFENVLCIEGDHNKGLDWKIRRDECVKDGLNYYLLEYFDECVEPFYGVSVTMKKFIEKYCKDQYTNKSLVLVSKCKDKRVQKMQAEWVKERYSTEMVSVCSKFKLDSLLDISSGKVEGIGECKPNEILLIDNDVKRVLVPCAELGFQACTPLEIADWMYRKEV